MDSEVGRVYLTADVRDLDKVRAQVEELRRLATQTNQGSGGIPTNIGPVGGGSISGARSPLSQADANAMRNRGVSENYLRENFDIGGGGGGGGGGGRGGGGGDIPRGRIPAYPSVDLWARKKSAEEKEAEAEAALMRRGGGSFGGRGKNVIGGDPEKFTGGGGRMPRPGAPKNFAEMLDEGRGGGRMPRPGAPKNFAEMLDEGRGGGRMPRSAAPATFEEQLANARGAPGLMFAMQRKGQEELAESQKKLAKESKDAAGSVQQFGLRTAWVIRSAMGGGPMGMVGGGVGALAGLAFGNPGFGALMGNMAGRKMGDTAGTVGGWAGLASPATGYNLELAGRDMRAAIGRPFTSAVDYAASKMRQVGDAAVANEAGLGKFSRGLVASSEYAMQYFGINQMLGLETGKSRGAAFSPLQGRIFGSGDEVYHSVAGISMKLNPARDDAIEAEKAFAIQQANKDRARLHEQKELLGIVAGSKRQIDSKARNDAREQRPGENDYEWTKRLGVLDGKDYSSVFPMMGPLTPTNMERRDQREAEVVAGTRAYRDMGRDILDSLSEAFIGPPVIR